MSNNVKEIVQGLNQSLSGRTFAFPANGISPAQQHQMRIYCHAPNNVKGTIQGYLSEQW